MDFLARGESPVRLTPTIVVAAYEFLRSTPPFASASWKLPESDEVEFRITRFRYFAEYDPTDGSHVIAVSERKVAHTETLLKTIAHEMVHLSHAVRGVKTDHGAPFVRDARTVCRQHGWDPKEF
jgi:hypothetical protein